MAITKEQKEVLFPYFAYLYSKKMNPEKYSSATSVQEWVELIQDNKEDIDAITKAATQLTDEDWKELEDQYHQEQQIESEKVQMVAKGAKLKKLKGDSIKNANKEVTQAISKPVITQGKKGMKAKRKCSCGCNLILSKENGGKVTEKCSCNCKGGKLKMKKK